MTNGKKGLLSLLVTMSINFFITTIMYKIKSKSSIDESFFEYFAFCGVSFIVYIFWLFSYKLSEIIKTNTFIPIITIIFSILGIILSLISIRKENILFLPLMICISLLGVSIYWAFIRKREDREDK